MPSSYRGPNESTGAYLPSGEAYFHIRELQHEHWMVRLIAAEALAKIRDAQAVEPLCARLWDENRRVRVAVAWALGQIGDFRAVEPLGIAFKSWRGTHRYDAARALWQIEGQLLPWRLLAATTLTPAQKLKALQGLIGVTFTRKGVFHDTVYVCYTIKSVQVFCEEICRQDDIEEEVKQGAEAVLRALRHRTDANMLLRASNGEETYARLELLRAAFDQSTTTPPEELLRPTETSFAPADSQKPGILSRIFYRK